MKSAARVSILMIAIASSIGHAYSASRVLYRDPQHRFTMWVPDGWMTTVMGDGVEFGRGQAYFRVVVLQGNGTTSSLVTFLTNQIAKQWMDFQQVTSGNCSFARKNGAFVIYSGSTPQGIDVLGRIVATAADGKGYALLISVPKDKFSILRPDLVNMEQSFSLENGQAADQTKDVDLWAAMPAESKKQASVLAKAEVAAPSSKRTALRDIKKVFVAPMANDLDQYIRAEIGKQLGSRLIVVLNQQDADGVLTGTGDWQKGMKAAITGRWLGMHDTATGTLSLVANDGNTILWASEAGDRSLMWGVMRRGGPRKVAERLVHNLKAAM